MVRYLSLLLFIGLVFWTCGKQDPVSANSEIQSGGITTIDSISCSPIDELNQENLCTATGGTDGVKILGRCYSIENTIRIDLSWENRRDSLPPEIGLLTNLTYLDLSYNQLKGNIQIC